MVLGLGSFAIVVSLWIIAQDPTIQTFRRRIRFMARLNAPRRTRPRRPTPPLADPVPELLRPDNA